MKKLILTITTAALFLFTANTNNTSFDEWSSIVRAHAADFTGHHIEEQHFAEQRMRSLYNERTRTHSAVRTVMQALVCSGALHESCLYEFDVACKRALAAADELFVKLMY